MLAVLVPQEEESALEQTVVEEQQASLSEHLVWPLSRFAKCKHLRWPHRDFVWHRTICLLILKMTIAAQKKVLEFLSVATDAICQDRSKKRGLVCAAYHRPDSPLAHASENYLQREASLASDAGCPHQRTSDRWSVLDVLGD